MNGQPDGGPDGAEGICASCGRPLPSPDLEAVAASIDQTLSLETGKVVPRTAWAGKAPDGALDALFSFLPGAKARRRLWERGQQLWTEPMSAAMSGPCDDCRADGVEATAGATLIQMPGGDRPEAGAPPFVGDEAGTTAMPAYRDAPDAPDDLPTSAVASFGSSFGAVSPPEPADQPPSDEHESHTVMLSSLPSLRTTTRLVVLDGPVHGRQFSLGRPLTTIGRSIGCHVTVEDDAVSYDHARIVRTDSGWRLEPIDAGAELLVDDAPVGAGRSLQNGDVIRVGSARLRFESTSQAG
jgi:hypothetical protein